MSDCCENMGDLCNDIDFNVKKTDKGVTITIETENPEKAKAMMVMCCSKSDSDEKPSKPAGEDKKGCC